MREINIIRDMRRNLIGVDAWYRQKVPTMACLAKVPAQETIEKITEGACEAPHTLNCHNGSTDDLAQHALTAAPA